MGQYAEIFKTHDKYESSSGKAVWNYCIKDAEIHYDGQEIDPFNGHEYVDLGLPSGTLWATMNVGATNELEYGNYYQYGKGAATYQETKDQSNYLGTEDPLDTSVDTASQAWGGAWHMPTKEQISELIANTRYQWVTIGELHYGRFVSKVDSSKYITIPTAGNYSGGSGSVNVSGYIWSSSPYDESRGYNLMFYDVYKGRNASWRYTGYSVRPVVG